jgi:hypothetical protein
MSAWGVFYDADRASECWHVMPCDRDGFPRGGHLPEALTCWCHPQLEAERADIIVHNDRDIELNRS